MKKAVAQAAAFLFCREMHHTAGMFARTIPLFAILLLLLAGCDAPAPSGLTCEWSAGGLYARSCAVEGNDAFLGVALGMEKHAAFEALCAKASAGAIKRWMIIVHKQGKLGRILSTRTLRCSDWVWLQQSDIWMLQTAGAPCDQDAPRRAVVDLAANRVFRVHVWCEGKLKGSPSDLLPWNWI